MSAPKLILYIASSLDGFIAGPHDDLSFLESVAREGEDYGYAAFMKSVDTVIMGRNTYDWVIKHAEYPHAQLQSYIITHRTEEARPGIIFYQGNLKNLIQELKAKQAKNIFCDGGASLLNQLLQLGCIDEIILSIIPVLLGKGTRLFHELEAPLNLHLLKSESFASGLVQVHYRIL